MPFDGTQQVDEVGEILLKAKEVLKRKGWCTGIRTDQEGRHCALGAIDATGYSCPGWEHPVIQRLARFVPEKSGQSSAHIVAAFNNNQTDVQVIYDWFDRAAYNL